MIIATNSNSMLTNQILIPNNDGSFELNARGELYKFIGFVDFIEQETKQISRVKFESQIFELENCADVHSTWCEFHKTIELQAEQLKHTAFNMSKDKALANAPKRINITILKKN